MAAIFVVCTGVCRGLRFELEPGRTVTLGRAPESGFVLLDPQVSRAHCTLAEGPGGVTVTDLGSRNGTRVDGRPVATGLLRDGDSLRLGEVALSVHVVPGPLEPYRPRTVALLRPPATRVTVQRVIGPDDPGEPEAAAHGGVDAVRRVCRAIQGRRGVDATLHAVVESVREAFGARRVSAVLRDAGSSGFADGAAAGDVDPGSDRYEVARPLVDAALERGASTLGSIGKAPAATAVMCVPLRGGDGPLGALYLSAAPGGVFDEAGLAALAAVGVEAGLAVERARLVERLEASFTGGIRALVAAVEARDPYTRGHSERVTAYALAIADWIGLEPARRQVVEVAGLLHDAGKIGVPEAVLHKAADLDTGEHVVMREHPARGEAIVRSIRHPAMRAVQDAIRHHHERWDGAGYPDGLAGEAIGLASRILAVADTWDAMTSDRPYRKALDASIAMARLEEGAGTQLDPGLVAAFRASREAGLAVTMSGLPPRRSRYATEAFARVVEEG